MSAFALYVGAKVLYEGRPHTVTDVILNGPTAPYGRLRCDDHDPYTCEARHGKVTWHSLQWVEPAARDEHSVSILLRGQEVG